MTLYYMPITAASEKKMNSLGSSRPFEDFGDELVDFHGKGHFQWKLKTCLNLNSKAEGMIGIQGMSTFSLAHPMTVVALAAFYTLSLVLLRVEALPNSTVALLGFPLLSLWGGKQGKL